jgi:glycine cleavage system aminomethyltransferase T
LSREQNGKRIRYIRAPSYGHTIGGAVGLTMLEDNEPITKESSGELQIEIVNKRYPCKVSFAPFYDPKNLRDKM